MSFQPHNRAARRECFFALEVLEDRSLLTTDGLAPAPNVEFLDLRDAHADARGFLADGSDYDLYQVNLEAGEVLTIAVDTSDPASGLDGYLRVFDSLLDELFVNEDSSADDPVITFQAATDGNYYFSVSPSGNTTFDVRTGAGTNLGDTAGLYRLDVSTIRKPLQPDVVVADFEVLQETAEWGQGVTVNYRVENRGGAKSPAFAADIVLSAHAAPSEGDEPLTQIRIPALEVGESVTETRIVRLPGSPKSPPSGFADFQDVKLEIRNVLHFLPSPTSDRDWLVAGTVIADEVVREEVAAANLLPQVTETSGVLRLNEVDAYQWQMVGGGWLDLELQAGGPLNLTFLDGLGSLLFQQVITDADGWRSLRQEFSEAPAQKRLYLVISSDSTDPTSYRFKAEVRGFVPDEIHVSYSPRQVNIEDVDSDGNRDLIIQTGQETSLLLGRGDGSFQSRIPFPEGQIRGNFHFIDVNSDGWVDLLSRDAANSLSILPGRGDGTFESLPQSWTSSPFSHIRDADFDADGSLDLLLVHGVSSSDGASLLKGLGDGRFTAPRSLGIGTGIGDILPWDVNSDGYLDLIATEHESRSVSVFLGDSTGGFNHTQQVATGSIPATVQLADFNADDRIDIFVSNLQTDDASVLLANSDGTFQKPLPLQVDSDARGFTLADVNSDKYVDVLIPAYSSGEVLVLLGHGDGTFQRERRFEAGQRLTVTVADVNSDGHLDILTTNYNSADVSVLLGNGDGTFQSQMRFNVGREPNKVWAADFNSDGHVDLVVSNSDSESVSILLGHGDGAFAMSPPGEPRVNLGGVQSADLNSDGHIDLIRPHPSSHELQISLGIGNGTFRAAFGLPLNEQPTGTQIVDVNRDGRLDLVVAYRTPGNSQAHAVAVYLGNGDGTYQSQQQTSITRGFLDFRLVDLNSDDSIDILAFYRNPDEARVLLGNGDGSFQSETTSFIVRSYSAPRVEDVDGDGYPDIITNKLRRFSDPGPDEICVHLGVGDGTFLPCSSYAVGEDPGVFRLGDVNSDGNLDILTSNRDTDDISILLGDGNGSFRTQSRIGIGRAGDDDFLLHDLNADGHLDILTSHESSGLFVLLGHGDGTFQGLQSFPVSVEDELYSLELVDVNADGFIDILARDEYPTVWLYLGIGDGTFESHRLTPEVFAPSLVDVNGDLFPDVVGVRSDDGRATALLGNGEGRFEPVLGGALARRGIPILADLNSDGRRDALLVDNRGRVQLRIAYPNGQSLTGYLPPFVVNSDSPPAQHVSFVTTALGPRVAVLNQQDLELYEISTAGAARLTTRLPVPGRGLAQVTAVDLTSDGLEDLAILASGSSDVLVFQQQPDGTFQLPQHFSLGNGSASLTVQDVDGRFGADLIVTNYVSGDITILLNDPGNTFGREYRYRADLVNYHTETQSNPLVSTKVSSPAGTFGAVALSRQQDEFPDLLVLNLLTKRVNRLPSVDQLGWGIPQTVVEFGQHQSPSQLRMGDFNADERTDFAVVDEALDQLFVFVATPEGDFQEHQQLSVDPSANGLTVADANNDGKLDLLVGNEFGDLLIFLGDGDGTFRNFQRADRTVTLATADLNGDGWQDAVVANESNDVVRVQYRIPDTDRFSDSYTDPDTGEQVTGLTQTRADGLQAPGGTAFVDINSDGLTDLLLLNSGSNKLRTYLGQDDGTFVLAAETFTGTNPVDFVLRDYDGDGLQDVAVVNNGSNDVSILLNDGTDSATGTWNGFRLGPRLDVGANPTAISNQSDAETDEFLGLTVTTTNGGRDADSGAVAGSVELVPNLGQGFFDDGNPIVTNLPGTPGATDFGGGSAFVPVGGTIFQVDPVNQNVTAITPDLGASGVVVSNVDGGGLDLLALTSSGIQLVLDALGNVEIGAFLGIGNPSAAALAALEGSDLLQMYVTVEGSEVITVFDLNNLEEPPETPTLPFDGSLISSSLTSILSTGLTAVVSLISISPLGVFFEEIGFAGEEASAGASQTRSDVWGYFQEALGAVVQQFQLAFGPVLTSVGLNGSAGTPMPGVVTTVFAMTPPTSLIGELAVSGLEFFSQVETLPVMPEGFWEDWLLSGLFSQWSSKRELEPDISLGSQENPEQDTQQEEPQGDNPSEEPQQGNVEPVSGEAVAWIAPRSTDRSAQQLHKLWWDALLDEQRGRRKPTHHRLMSSAPGFHPHPSTSEGSSNQ